MEPHGQARGTTPNAPPGRTSRTRGPIHPRVNPWSSWCWDSLPMEVKKGDGAVLKIGDRFKDKTAGKIYIIKMEIDNGTLFLEGENGLGRRLTGKESLRRTCEKLEDIKS